MTANRYERFFNENQNFCLRIILENRLEFVRSQFLKSREYIQLGRNQGFSDLQAPWESKELNFFEGCEASTKKITRQIAEEQIWLALLYPPQELYEVLSGSD